MVGVGVGVSNVGMSSQNDEIVNGLKYSRKKRYLRCLTGFVIHLPKGFMVLYLTLKHLKYHLNISKCDPKPCDSLNASFFLYMKKLSNQLIENSSFPLSTTLESQSNVNFSSYNLEIVKTFLLTLGGCILSDGLWGIPRHLTIYNINFFRHQFDRNL